MAGGLSGETERWSREARTDHVRKQALGLGFHKVGFARADAADPSGRLREWLDRGFGGELDYMYRTREERADPRRYVEGARSVVALAISYYRPDYTPHEPLKIARYAIGDDYHAIIKKKVRKLRRMILAIDPAAKVAPTVDTSPVLEREWAGRAGIAWIGKSTMAIAQDLGTYTFLATLVTTMEFVYDEPHPDRCGSCTRCLDACPTQAFVGPYELDARRCITYWNVEVREGPFDANTPPLHGWLAGCDVCQEVCPWNKFKRAADEPRFEPRSQLTQLSHRSFEGAHGESEIEDAIRGTALARTGSRALDRNARAILDDEND